MYVPPSRHELSAEARAAADAAVARIQKTDKREFNTSLAAIRQQVQREIEAERKAKQQEEEQAAAGTSAASSVKLEENKNLAVQGVFFRYYLNILC